jgi:hypothetical protein
MQYKTLMKNKTKQKGYLWAVFNSKCPRCREGDIFKNKGSYHLRKFMQMNDNCPVCKQQTEIEQGFYYGTGYVSYALSVAFSVSTFIAWWVLIGFSFDDDRVFWWLGINTIVMLILQPWFMRLSRSIWLSFFVKYDENWQPEKSKIMAL